MHGYSTNSNIHKSNFFFPICLTIHFQSSLDYIPQSLSEPCPAVFFHCYFNWAPYNFFQENCNQLYIHLPT